MRDQPGVRAPRPASSRRFSTTTPGSSAASSSNVAWSTGERAGLVDQLPIGVVGAIVPWNAPVTIAAWKVSAALAAGCTVVLKPPPEAPLSNYLLVEALEEAGVPAGVINLVPGGREVGEHLVTHPGTDKIAFTGSTAAGKRIMSLCGDQVKRVSLELGGKSASIVLDDADFDTVVPRIVAGVMHLSGQVCGAHTRVLVPAARYAEVVDLAATAADAIPVGDPHDPATVVGPLVAERQRERVEELHRLGGRRRGTDRGRRHAPGPPPEGLVRVAHGPRRCRQLHAGGARGDLRARAVPDPLRRRRRRGPDRQRLPVRTGRRGVVGRRRARASPSPVASGPAASA